MGQWVYEICDNASGDVLLRRTGFDNVADAGTQAQMDISVANIKNCRIRTYQEQTDSQLPTT